MREQEKYQRTRTARISLDLTIEEREQLRAAARQARVSMQALIRTILAQQEVFSPLES